MYGKERIGELHSPPRVVCGRGGGSLRSKKSLGAASTVARGKITLTGAVSASVTMVLGCQPRKVRDDPDDRPPTTGSGVVVDSGFCQGWADLGRPVPSWSSSMEQTSLLLPSISSWQARVP